MARYALLAFVLSGFIGALALSPVIACLAEEELHAQAASLNSLPPAGAGSTHASKSSATGLPTGLKFEVPKLDATKQQFRQARVETNLTPNQKLQVFSGSQLMQEGSTPARTNSSQNAQPASDRLQQLSEGDIRMPSYDQYGYQSPNAEMRSVDARGNSISLGKPLDKPVALKPGFCMQLVDGSLKAVPPAVQSIDWGEYWEGQLYIDQELNQGASPGSLLYYDELASAELYSPGTSGKFFLHLTGTFDKLTVAPPAVMFTRPAPMENWCWTWADILTQPTRDIVFHVIKQKILKDDVVSIAPNVVEQSIFSHENHSCPGYQDDGYSEDVFRYTKLNSTTILVQLASVTYDRSGKCVERLFCHGELHRGEKKPAQFYLSPWRYFPNGDVYTTMRPNSPGNVCRIDKL